MNNDRLHVPGQAVKQLQLDGAPVTTPEGERFRVDACMMGMGSETLEMMAEAIANRVIEKLDARALKLEGEERDEEDSHQGPAQTIPPDANVWEDRRRS